MSAALFCLSPDEVLLLDLLEGASPGVLVRPLSPDEREGLRALLGKDLEIKWLDWPSSVALLQRPERADAWAELQLWGPWEPDGKTGWLAVKAMKPTWRVRFTAQSAFALIPPGGLVEIRAYRWMGFTKEVAPKSRFVAVRVALDEGKNSVSIDVGEREGFRPQDRAARLLEIGLSSTGAEGKLRGVSSLEEAGWVPDFLIASHGGDFFLVVVGKGKDGRVGVDWALREILGR